MGDAAFVTTMFYDAVRDIECRPSHLDLFPMPNVPDVRKHLLAQDVIYVGGGSVANLLAVWRVQDRKSTRLNSSHANMSYAVFCLKKKQSQLVRSNFLNPLTPSS